MLPTTFITALAGVSGLCLGSFLNVVAHRMPAGVSLVTPGSACPSCGSPIRAFDNVPVISWLALRGRCRSCRTAISPRYPLTEAACGLLFGAVALAKGASGEVWLDLVFVAALVVITRIDLEHQIIPNRIVGPLAGVAVVLIVLTEPGRLVEHLVAGALAGGFLAAAVFAYPAGMGMGDAKLAAVMGLVLGRAVAPALFVALIAGTLAGVAVMARLGVSEGRRTRIPFGPFLALGSIVGLFAGDALVNAYLKGFGL